jgi:hypothetical protein
VVDGKHLLVFATVRQCDSTTSQAFNALGDMTASQHPAG